MTRKTKAQKEKDRILSHGIDCRRFAEFSAAGVPEFANWCRTVEQALEIKAAGLTFEQWLPWRKEQWDLQKYSLPTPQLIANYVSRGMSVTDAKREQSRTYPAPMRTR